MRMHKFVKNVFPTSPITQKIQEYHDDTGEPIYFSLKQPFSLKTCPQETKLLQDIKQHLLPHQLSLVHQFLPSQVYETARKAFLREQYYRLKLQSVFLEHAIEQIREHDPFYLSMDDFHDMGMMLTELSYQQLYYKEKME